jgi:CBS domain-containing protein
LGNSERKKDGLSFIIKEDFMAEDSTGSESLPVKQFVIPLGRFPHIDENSTLQEAIEVINSFTCGPSERMRYSEILVLNGDRQLVGHATIQNMLEGLDPHLVPTAIGFEGKRAELPNLTALWGDSFFVECKHKFRKSIKEYMTPLPKAVKTSDSVLKALSIMLNSKETVLPVLEGDNVTGVIRLEEIFGAIVKRCAI